MLYLSKADIPKQRIRQGDQPNNALSLNVFRSQEKWLLLPENFGSDLWSDR
jgi:hypothetical protein